MSTARKLAALGVAALLALQLAWHGLLFPAAGAARWPVTALFAAPLLAAVILFIARRPSAQFWAGVAALFYFCHGVTESWVGPQARPLALLELVLSVLVIVVGSWDGIKARFGKRGGPPTNV